MLPKLQFKDKKCKQCGKSFNRGKLRSGRDESPDDFRIRKYCSKQCYFNHNTGKNHWLWRGGIKRRPDGYVRDSKTDKYIHRVNVEKMLKRKLKPNETVHHLDGNPSNNDCTNLVVLTSSEHSKIHVASRIRDKKGRWCP